MAGPTETFPGFEVLGELGRGTTGVVYEARDARLGLRVALKVLSAAPESEPVARARFLRECRVLACLTSGRGRHIPCAYAAGEDLAGRPYLVRELLEGSSLERRAEEGSLGLREGLAVVAAVARVVQWVHGQGFAHRNLSAANVLVGHDGRSWLIGFGRVGLLAGSPLAPAGAAGTPPEADVRGLRDLLAWLCGALGQPVPADLERATAAGAVLTAGAWAEAVGRYLNGSPA